MLVRKPYVPRRVAGIWRCRISPPGPRHGAQAVMTGACLAILELLQQGSTDVPGRRAGVTRIPPNFKAPSAHRRLDSARS